MPVEYKSVYAILEKTVAEGADSLSFLKRGDNGMLHLSKEHKYFSQINAQMAIMGAKYVYFVQPFVEKISFDTNHWEECEKNSIKIFKSSTFSHQKQSYILFQSSSKNGRYIFCC